MVRAPGFEGCSKPGLGAARPAMAVRMCARATGQGLLGCWREEAGAGRRRLGGLAGWAVAVQDPVAVGAGHGHGGVRVEDDLPALAVDEDQMVEAAKEGEVDQAGRAAFVAG